MSMWFKLLCYTVWTIFAGYLVYLGFGGPGTENVGDQASIGLMGIGITIFLYAIYIGKKGFDRYCALIPFFLGLYNYFLF